MVSWVHKSFSQRRDENWPRATAWISGNKTSDKDSVCCQSDVRKTTC